MHRYTLPVVLILLTGCPSTEEQAADVFTEGLLFTAGNWARRNVPWWRPAREP